MTCCARTPTTTSARSTPSPTPAQTEIVYVGDTEQGRDVRGRLRDHMSRRDKAGRIELDSLVFVHVMVTEFMVMKRFQEEFGRLPVLNKVNVPKHGLKSHGGRLAYRNGPDETRDAPVEKPAAKPVAKKPAAAPAKRPR